MNALVALGLSSAGDPRVEFLNVRMERMERSFFPIPDPRRLDLQIFEHLSSFCPS